MAKIRKAESHEKKNYSGVYPLFGYFKAPATVMGYMTELDVAVEYLGEGKDQPNYEAILPKGMNLEGMHTVLASTQRELVERLTDGLDECDSTCSCLCKGE